MMETNMKASGKIIKSMVKVRKKGFTLEFIDNSIMR